MGGNNNCMTTRKMTLICAIVVILFSCGDDSYKATPAKFKQIVKINQALFIADKDDVYSIIKKMIDNKVSPFDKKYYDKSTQIFVDTLVYSPDLTKLIAFIITKNSTEKLLYKENNEKYYYNANYLFCVKNSDDGKISVFDYAAFNLVDFYSYKQIKEALNEYCFYRLLGESTPDNIHYNVDDVRFWQSKEFERVINNSKATQVP